MNEISEKTAHWLLNLARQSIEHFLETKNFVQYDKIKIPDDLLEEANRNSGGFILLEMQSNEHRMAYIRAENGVFDQVEQLGKLVTQIAVNAAFFDPHTPRLKAYELNELVIHLVIPAERERIVGSYAEVVAQMDLIGEGIIVETRGRVAYSLPPILPNQEESAEHRLRRLLLRLGIRKRSAENATDYFSFSSQHFAEKSV